MTDLFVVQSFRLKELQTQISGLMDQVEANACAQAQDSFNLASPEQVADILYTRLGLPAPPLKGSQKHPSTGEEVLESLRGAHQLQSACHQTIIFTVIAAACLLLPDKHAVVGLVLDYRALAKIKHSYLDTLLAYTGHRYTTVVAVADVVLSLFSDGLYSFCHSTTIHTEWNQCNVRTGR